ncbi:leucyl aminopeptidase [Agromyces mediolanus]|uniref:leucyl aminopeptidase n=1 Tax=Agromyces mediolanus TaxID=41986 RepID=UPI00203D5221|nr:leucyl aminopeptidase [Agromyces mediolanus]MCM3659080.1 leucyl aminopeptidase [Agromyces mediolanus]
MPIPTISLSASPAVDADAEVVVLASRSTDDGPQLLAPAGFEWAEAQLRALGAKGAADELVRLADPSVDGRVVAVAGTGAAADADALRLAAGSALRQLSEVDSVAIGIPAASAAEAAALLEGAALGAYRFNEYRSKPKPPVASITLHTEFGDEELGTERVRTVAEAVAATRDLVNLSPSELFPARFAEIAVDAARAAGIQATVYAEDELEAGGFGGLLGVGQGSVRGPRLVRLEYAPDGATTSLAFVGKGITFDSGGLSLKPMQSMVGMKGDMAGAAAVFNATLALARLNAPVRVTAWLCLAENLPSGTAMRPNDVLRIRGGKTVEVLNTDAEGRLVLADGLVAASEEQPDAIIDVATLTGAQLVALGGRITGLMGDDDLVQRVRDAAAAVDESLWPMPLPAHLLPLLKSDVADLTNTKLGGVVPGMLLAGVFLQEFVGERDGAKIPWAHLDIAGPADNGGAAWGFTGGGPTGIAVRTLVRLGEELAAG